jgi:hypothetical protein
MNFGVNKVCCIALLATSPVEAQDSVGPDDKEAGEPIVLIHNGPRDYIVVEGGVLGKPLSDRADPVRYIMEVEQGSGRRVENVIRDVPGWQQFRRSDARSANPTSQGLTARGLGGNAASRALLILDGVPQADPFGGWVNWTAFDSLYLKGMRIIDGGGSGADGPGALAGTIQMSTRRGGSHAALAYGSRNSIDADAHLSVDAGDGAITVTGNYSRGDGFIPIIAGQRGAVDMPAAYESYGAGVRFVANTEEAGRIEAAIRAFDDRRSRGLPFSLNRNSGVDASLRLLDEIGGMSSMLLAYARCLPTVSRFHRHSINLPFPQRALGPVLKSDQLKAVFTMTESYAWGSTGDGPAERRERIATLLLARRRAAVMQAASLKPLVAMRNGLLM